MIKIKKHSLKLISLFASIFLWVYVVTAEKVEIHQKLDLKVFLPKHMTLTQTENLKVKVSFLTSKWFSKILQKNKPIVVVDLRNHFKEKNSTHRNFIVKIEPDHIKFLKGVRVLSIKPETVELRLKQKSPRITADR